MYTYLSNWASFTYDSPDVNSATASPGQTVNLKGSFYLTQQVTGSWNDVMPWSSPFRPFTGPYEYKYDYDVTGTVPKAGYHHWVHLDALAQSGEEWWEEKVLPPSSTVLHKRYRSWYVPNGMPAIVYAP